MNTKTIIGLMAVTCSVISCVDDEPNYVTVETGEEVSFGVSRKSDEIHSRTDYGDIVQDGNGNDLYQKINWVDGDQIAIYCPEASQPQTHVVYKVSPDATDGTHSDMVTKVDPSAVGIQWGVGNEHNFYAFYPGDTQYLDKIDHGNIYATIPIDQQVTDWEYDELTKTWIGKPNMNLAFMYAKNTVYKNQLQNKDVPLEFHPLVTVLEITVNGPSDQSGLEDITITNINVNAVSGNNTVICGQFKCNLNSQSGGHGQCEPIDDGQTVRNRISISCWDPDPDNNPETDDGAFKVLRKGEKLKVKAFIVPDDSNIPTRALQVSVSPLNGSNFVEDLKTADVLAHKINRVTLPYLKTPGVNYWMSSLDPKVFVTELSIPGSKFSALSPTYGSSVLYQNTSIADQFKMGIRSFILQTGGKCEKDWKGEFESAKDLVIALDEKATDVSLKTPLLEIRDGLIEAKQQGKGNEFAVVMLTFSSGATDAGAFGAYAQENWMQTVDAILKGYASDPDLKDYIYGFGEGEAITPQTTIGDVAGKIIFKVNVNNESMGNAVSSTDMPAMFAEWKNAYPGEAGVPLHWGSSQNIRNTSDMTWLYQEVTHVGNPDGWGSDRQNTLEQKMQYIGELFAASLKAYQSELHNTWFMNDLGGNLDKNTTEGTKNLALQLTPYYTNLLQTRTDNAGLGLVFMNFADADANYGKLVKSPELIQTIIDNNFKFALRKK